MNIETWMDDFIFYWKNYDIEGVISLFDEEVEYWETPYQLVKNIEQLKQEWEYIKTQENIEIEYEVFSQHEDKFTILWNLKYNKKEVAGTYLIQLNSQNKCIYFHQTCEEKE